MTTTTGIPHRPGPIGRFVRLVLGLLTIQAAVGTALLLAEGPSGAPDTGDTGLVIAVVIAAWLTPVVYDVGLGTDRGNGWRLLVATGVGIATLVGLAVGAAATGLTIGVLAWVTITLGWLGLSFLVATALRTPGCELRALPHLVSVVLPGDREFVACPGPLQPLDEWEARTTGRAEPHRD